MNLSQQQLEAYIGDPVLLIAEQLVLESGRSYGDVMEPFQRAFFTAVFARVSDGIPVHRLAYDERRRGESKTEDCAAAAIADLFTGPAQHKSYAVAGDEDQASLILDSVRGFKARSPLFGDLTIQKSIVRNEVTGSELRVISSDAPTAYGIRPRKVFFDELSLQTDERLWTAMWTAIAKNPHSQMVAVSMAGWDFASLGWRIRELAAKNPRYYFHTREGSELAPWLSPADYEEQRETLHPADFARYWECRWTEPKGSWITREMYDAAEVGEEALSAVPGARYAGFVDVGLVHDPTAIAVCHLEDSIVRLDALRTLQGTRNEPVQLEAVEDLVVELTARFGVRHWIFEAPQAVASVQRLQARMSTAKVAARYPTADTQAELFGGLYQLFSNRRLCLYPHQQLRKEALNLVTKTVGGRLKVVDSAAIHQDHVVAVGGAAGMLLVNRSATRAIAYAREQAERYSQPESAPTIPAEIPVADPARPPLACSFGGCHRQDAIPGTTTSGGVGNFCPAHLPEMIRMGVMAGGPGSSSRHAFGPLVDAIYLSRSGSFAANQSTRPGGST